MWFILDLIPDFLRPYVLLWFWFSLFAAALGSSVLIAFLCSKVLYQTVFVDPNDDINCSDEVFVRKRGYTYEEHKVKTSDGYILTAQRITNPNASKTDLKPVLLMHGMGGNSFNWIVVSLKFIQ